MDDCTQWWILVTIGCMWVIKEFINYCKFHSKINEIDRKNAEITRRRCREYLEAEERRKRERDQNQEGNDS